MADSQMSHSGPYSVHSAAILALCNDNVHANCVDWASWRGSYPTFWVRVLTKTHESVMKIRRRIAACQNMVVHDKARLATDKSWKEVLNSQKKTGVQCHWFCMLSHWWAGFASSLHWGLCSWQQKYFAWIPQTLPANEQPRTPRLLRLWKLWAIYCLEENHTINDTYSIQLLVNSSLRQWVSSLLTANDSKWI